MAAVEVLAEPKDLLVVQLIWTKFDPDDDPSTFPRIELHSLNLDATGNAIGTPRVYGKPSALPGTPEAPPIVWGKTGGCSIEGTAPYCKAAAKGFTTVMSLEPAAAAFYAIGVHFTDDRVQGQAVPCVRSYRAGKLIADLCDTNARPADAWWLAGVIDSQTGKTVQTLAAERAQAAATAAAASATSTKPAASATPAAPATPSPRPR